MTRTWRAKHIERRIGRLEFRLTVRRFRIPSQRRAKSYQRLVISIAPTRIQEIELRWHRFNRQRARRAGGLPSFGRRLATVAPLIVMFLGIAGTAFFGHQVLVGKDVVPPKTFIVHKTASVVKAPAIKPLAASIPTSISIPSVDIQAPIMPVGKNPNGTIQMPPILDWTAGWYKYGPTPGQDGPAVIVGHVDNYESIWVFWELRHVKPGAHIYITLSDGQTAIFQVTGLQDYMQSSFPTNKVYGKISYPGLRIVTCGGTFSRVTESYNMNTVVYAKLTN